MKCTMKRREDLLLSQFMMNVQVHIAIDTNMNISNCFVHRTITYYSQYIVYTHLCIEARRVHIQLELELNFLQ